MRVPSPRPSLSEVSLGYLVRTLTRNNLSRLLQANCAGHFNLRRCISTLLQLHINLPHYSSPTTTTFLFHTTIPNDSSIPPHPPPRTSPVNLHLYPPHSRDLTHSPRRPPHPIASLRHPSPAHARPLFPSRQQTNPLRSLIHVLPARHPDTAVYMCSPNPIAARRRSTGPMRCVVSGCACVL
jgi:hypothetical protein